MWNPGRDAVGGGVGPRIGTLATRSSFKRPSLVLFQALNDRHPHPAPPASGNISAGSHEPMRQFRPGLQMTLVPD